MSNFVETVKVVSDNPEHNGYFIKNLADLQEGDVVYGEEYKTTESKAKVPEIEDKVGTEEDEFTGMSRDDLIAYLKEQGENPHHMTGEAKLREACRKVAAELV